jgi:hypothetical protein
VTPDEDFMPDVASATPGGITTKKGTGGSLATSTRFNSYGQNKELRTRDTAVRRRGQEKSLNS